MIRTLLLAVLLAQPLGALAQGDSDEDAGGSEAPEETEPTDDDGDPAPRGPDEEDGLDPNVEHDMLYEKSQPQPLPLKPPAPVLRQGQFTIRLDALSFARRVGEYDENGAQQTFDDQNTLPGIDGDGFHFDTLVVALEAGYGILDGLEVGASVPFVRNTFQGEQVPAIGPTVTTDQTGAGVGDVSVYVAGEFPSDQMHAGGVLYTKLPSGKAKDLDTDELAVGSGQADVGVFGFFRYPGKNVLSSRVSFDGRAGFIIRLAGERDDPLSGPQDYDPGDILFVEAGGTFWASERLGLGAAFLFYTAGQQRVEDSSGDLRRVADSEQSQASIAPHVVFLLNDKVSFSLSTRVRRIGTGRSRMDTGISLSGRNDAYSEIPPVTLGAEVRFP